MAAGAGVDRGRQLPDAVKTRRSVPIHRCGPMTIPFTSTNPGDAVALAGGETLADRLAATTHNLLGAADAERRLVWTNPAWQPLLGWTAEDLAAGSYHELVHPDDLPRVRQAESAVLAGLAGERPETELRLRARDGAYRWFLFSTSYSQPDGLVFLCGKELRAERKLQEHALELERSNAELEQFAYIASHDLSEPLRMISSYLQLLRRRYHGELDSDADEFIDFAVDGAARMRDLIDGLLTFSHAGNGDQPFEPVDLQALAVRAAAAVATPGGAAPSISVGPLPTVPGDAQGLGQLFQNLIGNALKFVPPDRVAEVGIDAEREGDLWHFTVTDNGIGLEPAYAERIFRMFQRLHTRDEYPGTGIGLAIAKKVVERHGGTIWAEPRADVGSRFSFTLPAATDEP